MYEGRDKTKDLTNLITKETKFINKKEDSLDYSVKLNN